MALRNVVDGFEAIAFRLSKRYSALRCIRRRCVACVLLRRFRRIHRAVRGTTSPYSFSGPWPEPPTKSSDSGVCC